MRLMISMQEQQKIFTKLKIMIVIILKKNLQAMMLYNLFPVFINIQKKLVKFKAINNLFKSLKIFKT